MKRHGSMNHIFRLVWSRVTNSWVAVAENTRGRGKGSKRKLVAAALSLTAVSIASISAHAAPTGGQVTAGAGTITQSGNTTTINQSSQNLSLNWNTFNIAPQETVNFLQPSTSAIAVNRIFDTNGSQILGHLNANGQVYLINPNGVLFGEGAQVNVGGLVASTLDIGDSSLGSNTRSFTGNGSGTVSNAGTITAANGGYVALLGNHVSNQGTIKAQLGTVALGGGSAVTLTFDGNQLVHLQVDKSVLNSLAQNGGLIQADGGQVIMSAGARDAILASVVNNTGVIEARSVESHDGVITLEGGMTAGSVNVGGTLDASAANTGNGGAIQTNAASVKVADGATITTAAPHGTAGTWSIDPTDFTIAPSGGDVTGTLLSNALKSGNVTIFSTAGAKSGSGNVNVNDVISWSANQFTLNAQNNININENLNGSGTAKLVLQYGMGAVAAGNTSTYTLGDGAQVNLPAGMNFSTQLGYNGVPVNYVVITGLGVPGSGNGADLQGINGNLSGNFVLGANIDASATSVWNGGAGFTPLGNGSATNFSGIFDGLGHSITNLAINTPSASSVGLFGSVATSGVIRNVELVNASISGNSNVAPLAGQDHGSITNSSASGTVSGYQYTGGLVGLLVGGSISNSSSSANETATTEAGGLVGEVGSGGSISYSYATGNVSLPSTAGYAGGLAAINVGTISDSYATGTVSVPKSYVAGGLVGMNYATITDSYSTSTVSGGTSYNIGGLVGSNNGSGTVSYSYASGAVTGGSAVGGLIGSNTATATNNYWNTTLTATGIGAGTTTGATGLTATQMLTASSFAGFTFTTTPGAAGNNWVLIDTSGSFNNSGGGQGATLPMLASEYSTSIANAHQLQLISMAPTASYALTQNINAAATSTGTDVWGNAQFVPLATPANSLGFTGTFNGNGFVISNLSINAPTMSNVGLFSQAASGSLIENVGMTGGKVYGLSGVGSLAGTNMSTISNSYATGVSLQAQSNTVVGGLVGNNDGYILNSHAASTFLSNASYVGGLAGTNNGGTAGNSYSSGTVTGTAFVGGLFGSSSGKVIDSWSTANVTANSAGGGLVGTNNGSISVSYATGNVTGSGSNIGGLVGTNQSAGTIANTYALGNETSTGTSVGGLVGNNSGSISDSYSAGKVSGATVGGLVATNNGTVSNSFWDTSSSGVSTSAAGRGGSTALMQMQADFTTPNGLNGGVNPAWDFGSTWVMYNGYTYPLLQAFMVPLIVAPNGSGKTYDGTAFSGGAGVTYLTQSNGLIAPTTPNANLLGSLTYGGTSQGAVNAGTYTITTSGLYSTQQQGGYIINFGYNNLTINQATLTVSGETAGNKVYDGTTAASLNGGTLSGVVAGDNVSLVQTGSFASKNVGSAIAVTVADTLTGTAAANYKLTQPAALSANITPASLTVSGETVGGKVYDGTTNATLSGGTLAGVVAGDSVTLTEAGGFASKNAGTNVAVTAADVLGGASAGNYVLTQTAGLSANITPATLTVTGETAANKVYNGNTTATFNGGTLSGVVSGDNVALTQSGTFATKNVGSALAVTTNDTLTGADAGNYTLVQPSGLTANVTPAPIFVSGETAANKVYDGTTSATLSGGTVSGIIPGDNVTVTQGGYFASKNAGTGVAIITNNTLSGADAGNYQSVSISGIKANITPITLTITGESANNKVYDGTTADTLSGGTLHGVLAGDNVILNQTGTFASKNAANGLAVTATDTLSGSDAGNYVFAQPTGLSANITPAPLTMVDATVSTKTYDGTTVATVNGGIIGGVVGETIVFYQNASFATQNVGNGIPVTVSLNITSQNPGNYSFTSPAGLTGNITPATLTVSGETANNKVYNGNTAATLSGGTLTGLVAGDTVTLTQAGSFASKNVGSNIGVTASDSLSGSAAGNYVLVQPTGLSANITPASLTVSGETAGNKVYDGTTSATLSGGTLSGVIAGDNVTLTQAGAFASKNAGSGVAVNTANTIGGSDAGNYTLVQPNGVTGNITPASLSVSGETATNKVYDGTTAATLSGGTLTGVIAGDNVSLTQAGSFASKNVGTGVAVSAANSLGGSDAGNYTLVQPTGLSASITPASLTVSGETAANKVYDGTTSATLSGGTLSGVVAGDNVSLTQAGSFASKNAGTGVAVNAANTIGGSDAGNYTLLQPSGLNANITPASLTVSGEAAANKVYDGTTSATLSGGTLSGIIGGDNVTLTQAGSFASKNAGTGVAVNAANTLGGSDAGNYTVVQPTGLSANITPASLSVSGETAANKVYDGTTTATLAGGTLTGVIAGDNVSLTQAGSFASKNVGTGVTVSAANSLGGSDAGNYTLAQPTGLAANITPASLTVSGETAANKVYDGTTAATLSGGTLAGVIAGDNVSLTQAGSFASKNAGTGVAVNAANTIAGSDAGNYTLVQPGGLSANITPATLTVTGETAGNKVYDGTTTATLSGGTLAGVIAGDSVSLTQAGAFASKNAGSGVAINAANTIGGTDSGNYTLTQPTGLSANITPASLTVTGETAANKVYDGTTTATLTGGTLSGVIAGDTVTLGQSGNFASKNVGTGIAVTATDTLGGTAAGNYTLVQPTGLAANITPASLTVSGETAANKVYDGTTTATLSGGTLAGVIAGDNVSLTQAGSFASKNAGSAVAVSTSDALNGSDAGNYTLVQPGGLSANITPATLAVTGETAANKVYNGTTTATLTGGTLTGVIAGDNVSLTQAGSFTSKNAGTGVAVNAANTISGTDSGNYTLTQPSGLSANITPASLTVTGETAANKVYDGTTAATLSGGTLSGVVAGDSVSLTQAGAFASKNAGMGVAITVADTLGGAGASNYTLVEPGNLSANITPAALTVSGETAATKVYNGTTAATLSGGTLVGVVAGDSVTLTQAGTFASKNVGTGIAVSVADTLGGTSAANYTLAEPGNVTGTITPASLTVTGETAANKVYNGTTAAALSGGTLVGVIAGDTVTLTQAGTFSSKNVGTGIAVAVNDTIAGTGASNYTLVEPASVTANITPLAITVTATGTNRVYNGTVADAVTLASSGVIAGDSVSFTDTSANFANKNVGNGKTVTVSGIAIGGANASDYTLTGTSATTAANVTPLAITVTATGTNRVYNGTVADSVTLAAAGVIAGDSISFTDTSANFANKNVGNGKTVTVSGIADKGTDAGNYTLLNTTATTTANITPLAITVTATGTDKVYDGTTADKVTLSSSGIIAGDVVNFSDLSATFADKNVGSCKPVTVTGISDSGTDAGNYTLKNTTATTSANITPATLTVSGETVANKVYDGTTTASLSGGKLVGVIAGDTVTLNQSGHFASANPGNNIAVTATDTLGGASDGNYKLVEPTGLEANITKSGGKEEIREP